MRSTSYVIHLLDILNEQYMLSYSKFLQILYERGSEISDQYGRVFPYGFDSPEVAIEDLIEMGLVTVDQIGSGEKFIRRRWNVENVESVLDRGAGGNNGPRDPGGGDGPSEGNSGRGLEEVICHPIMFAITKEDFNRRVESALGT